MYFYAPQVNGSRLEQNPVVSSSRRPRSAHSFLCPRVSQVSGAEQQLCPAVRKKRKKSDVVTVFSKLFIIPYILH